MIQKWCRNWLPTQRWSRSGDFPGAQEAAQFCLIGGFSPHLAVWFKVAQRREAKAAAVLKKKLARHDF